MLRQSIPALLTEHRTAGLIQAPLVIHRLPRVSAALGADIYILRDDLTGFGIGGNKSRKVDFLFGNAITQGANALVTIKATSFSRNAAAAASVCGLELHVVLPGVEAEQNRMSQSLFAEWGTCLHYGGDSEALAGRQDELVATLNKQGNTVYVLHPGGSDAIGALSYVSVMDEIRAFSERTDIWFARVIHSTSSAGTQAGLLVGRQIVEYPTEIIGVSAARPSNDQSRLVGELAAATAQLLGITVDVARIVVDDQFVGPGYAQVSAEGESAAHLFARMEGILLDPVYTGKAAAALLSYAEHGALAGGPALFIHTGGNGGQYY
ncbi:MAG: pyridoxal-phosphate dependent enzyme [Gemmatimonadaceae bacterium]|nr:pyridoxal-phosphate dependent enzyme [Gemmatimonadaceae bacterium]